MGLCHYLSPACISLSITGDTKEALLKNATEFLASANNLPDPNAIFALIWDRERSASTFLPMGVAVPHARITGIDDIKMVMCLIPNGFPNVDDPELPPIHVVCAFVSPNKETAFAAHLKVLSQIAAVFEDAEFTNRLATSLTPEAAFSLLQQHERCMKSA